jgi:hypothetical protein
MNKLLEEAIATYRDSRIHEEDEIMVLGIFHSAQKRD